MKHSSILRTAAVLLSAFVTAAVFPSPCAYAESVPPGAVSVINTDMGTTFYYDTPASGGMTAMWNDAVSASAATVKLFTDWTSVNGTQLVTEGKGAAFNGVICVPSGHEVTIDLNGHSIDRALSASVENGEVIYVESGATLKLTDTTAASGGAGRITGGNSTNSAGGIQVAAGGKLIIWGGSISGNHTDASGGGIVLDGEGASLYMTGGKIEKNTADGSGGGIAMASASVEVISGNISENAAGENGGGIFQQGGTVSFQAGSVSSNSAVSGGGICTLEDASLSLRGSATIQNNVAGTAEQQGRGGGIFAQGSKPVIFADSPSVTGNRQSDGTISNLTFFVSSQPFVGPRVEDQGVTGTAVVGVNFVGGEEREMGFAPSWNTNIFKADGAFQLIEADQVYYLKRPASPEDYMPFVWIGMGAIVVILIVLITTILVAVKKKKNRRKKRKKRSSQGQRPVRKQG
ncbi:MAG: hypothetical protein K6F80_00415 [Oscillospiraceae bacterium]|nr:hypothetical protein [Oscillospiraceae bacterium]